MLHARLATMHDLATVEAITHAAYAPYVPELGERPLPMTEDHAARIAAGGAWLVSDDGADIALMELEQEPAYLLIFSLAVLPAGQGRGAGQWMLRFIEARARALHLPEIRLYTNDRMTRNIRLYQQAGFIETGRRPNDRRPGWTFVDMAKTL